MINETVCDNYQDRLICEYQQLKSRYDNLRFYVNRVEVWKDYPGVARPIECDTPLELLKDQLYTMNEYLIILEKRALIERINLEVHGPCAIQNESGLP